MILGRFEAFQVIALLSSLNVAVLFTPLQLAPHRFPLTLCWNENWLAAADISSHLF